MYQRNTGSYDEIPDGMKRYLNNYGCHFNKKLYEEAVSRMYRKVNGKKEKMNTYSKEHVDRVLATHGIALERGEMYDACYVFTMCASDFLGKSVPNEQCQAMFVKDMIDDADAVDGYIFNRWYADTVYMNKPVEWDDMM